MKTRVNDDEFVIRVDEMPDGGEVRRAFDLPTAFLAALELDPDLLRPRAVTDGGNSRVEFRVSRVGPTVHGTGRAWLECGATCVRCLREFVLPLSVSLEVTALPRPSGLTSHDRDELTEDVGLEYYANGRLDLTEAVREQVLFEVPAYPICSDVANSNEPCPGPPVVEGERDPPPPATRKLDLSAVLDMAVPGAPTGKPTAPSKNGKTENPTVSTTSKRRN